MVQTPARPRAQMQATVDAVLQRHPRDESSVVMLLQELQQQLHYLPATALTQIASHVGVPPARILSVATFYKSFSLVPKGQTVIQVCKGTACHVRGAQLVHDELERELNIKAGQTTSDGRVTLEIVNCVGACALAPVVVTGQTYHGHVEAAQLRRLIRQALERDDEEVSGSNPAKNTTKNTAENTAATETIATGPHFKNFTDLAEYAAMMKTSLGKLRSHVIVCGGPGCLASGARQLLASIREAATNAGVMIHAEISPCHHGGDLLSLSGCQGLCQRGPLVRVLPWDWLYVKANATDAKAIVDSIIQGVPVTRLFDKDAQENDDPAKNGRRSSHPFFKSQVFQALSVCGQTHAESLNHYLALDGFRALAKALGEMTAEQVLEQVQRAGLRGRGGAGFAAARKWKTARDAARRGNRVPYVLCNGDEGDPGAFMDRAIMEGSPYQVIEGMMLGALAVGAREGYIYVRAEYPLAVSRLRLAIAKCRNAGLLGDNILGSGWSFDVRVSTGAGAFVCGESTALMRSLEGKVGEPRAKYERSAERGFHDAPTVLNNVETWALVPEIIRDGAEAFVRVGTKSSTGTKTFSLTGQVQRTGLVEVPMGTTLRSLIFDIGGGMLPGRQFKSVQTGGPSGGCLPQALLDLPVDFDALVQAGSMMGSGGMIVCDNTSCMVDVARYFIDFLLSESCGKCVPCRLGLQQMSHLLNKLTRGRGINQDIDAIERLASTIQFGSLCGLGKSAVNPVLSTLRYFRDEYRAHVDGWCPAGVCRDLVRYEITEECNGCTACVKRCPHDAIDGLLHQPHHIHAESCSRCGICRSVCRFNAIRVVSAPRPSLSAGYEGSNS